MAKVKVLENTKVKLGKGTLHKDALNIIHEIKSETKRTSNGGDMYIWSTQGTDHIGIFNLEKVNGQDPSDYLYNFTKINGNQYYIRLFSPTGTVLKQYDVTFSFVAYRT